MTVINSRQNEQIKYIRRLLSNRTFRDQEGRFLVEGLRFTRELLAADWPVEQLLLTPALAESAAGEQLTELAARKNIAVQLVSEQILPYISETAAPQGVAALAGQKDFDVPALLQPALNIKQALPGLLVLADCVQDPGNLGTIIRLADAAGAGGVLSLSGSVDLYNGKTLRATVGSLFHLPVVQNLQWPQLYKQLKHFGWQIIAGAPQAEQLLCQQRLPLPCVLVIGNEANGISEQVLAAADQLLAIPMPGRSESLNASAAAAIMIYEVVRQQLGY